MADEIKGLQIDLGLKDAGVKRSVSAIQRSFRGLNTDLRLTDKMFKSSEKSIDGYKDEINKLELAQKGLGKNLSDLKGEYESVSRTSGVTSQKAIKLKNEYNKQAISAQILQGRIDKLGDEYKELARSQALVFSTNSRLVQSGKAVGQRYQAVNQTINRLGDSFRNMGYIARSMAMGGVVANISAIIPVAGSAVSALAGLGGATTALAGGAIGLGGVYATALGGVSVFAGMAATSLARLEDGTLKITGEVTKYQTALKGLKSEWYALGDANQANIFNTMSNGINIARVALQQLTPAINAISGIISKASLRMFEWVKNSKNANQVFSVINKNAPPIFQNLVNVIMKVTDGMAKMFVLFQPLFTWVAQGLDNMAVKFNKWANSASTESGVAKFIKYTQTNLPIVGKIFGNIFGGFVGLFQAFSGHSHTVLVGMQRVTQSFKEWGQSLSSSDKFRSFIDYLNTNGPTVWQLLKNIGSVIVNVGQNMAPLGAQVLGLTTAFTGWLAKMTEAHPNISKLLGGLTILVGSFMTITPAVALLSAGIGPLVLKIASLGLGIFKLSTYTKMWSGVTKIATGVQAAWRAVVSGSQTVALAYMYSIDKVKNAKNLLIGKIKALSASQTAQTLKTKIATVATKAWGVATKVAGVATRGLGLAIRFMTGPVGLVITAIGLLVAGIIHLWKTNATFRNTVIKAWNAIKSTGIAVFNGLRSFLSKTWNWIVKTGKSLFNSLRTGIVSSFTKIYSGARSIFTSVKNFVVRIWTVLKNTVIKLVKLWWTGVKLYFTLIKTIATTIFSAVKSVVIKIWTSLKNTVIKLVKLWWTGVKLYFTLIKKVATTIFSAVKSTVIKIWTSLKNAVVKIVKAWFDRVKQNFNLIKSVATKVTNAVKSVVTNLWSKLKNSVTKTVTSLYNKIRSTFNSIRSKVSSITTSIRNTMTKIWNFILSKVTKIVTNLYNKVRSTFNNMNNKVRSIVTALKNKLLSLWNTIRSKIVGIVQSLYSKARKIFNTLRSSVQNIVTKLRNKVVSLFTNIKSKTTSLINGAKNAVTSKFKGMYEAGKSWLNKLKNFIGNSIGGFKKKATDLGKGVANSAIKGLNSMIGGINKISKAITSKSLIKKIPTLSTGTGDGAVSTNSQGQLTSPTTAIVNDKGPGNGTGINGHQEIIQRSDGSMYAPRGRNVMLGLGKGDSVISGKDTQRMQRMGMIPRFSTGTIPRLNGGTKNDKKKKNDPMGDLKNFAGNVAKGTGEKISDGYHSVDKAGKDAHQALKDGGDVVKDKAKKGATWLGDKIGDVMDYIDDPGKLVKKMMGNISFGGKNANATMRMAGGAFNKLKKSLVGKVKAMFAESEGGDGDASWLPWDNLLQKFGHYTGGLMFNGGRHYGLDFGMPTGTKLRALTDGKISQAGPVSGGGGNQVTLDEPGGKWFQWYMHMSKIIAKKGQKVSAGEVIGLSGNTGNSTTPHLHIQRMKGRVGNDTAVDPTSWLKGLGKGGGTNKAAGKWATDIKKAAKRMKVNLSGGELNGIIKQIQRESNGNAGVTQGNIGDINNLRGTPAQGLLQYVPSTFKSYAVKGHNNIKSGYDQLLAFFNNKNWRRDLPYGRSGWGPTGSNRGFASGGLIKSNGMYNIAEGGYPEWVIPTDPSKKNDAMKMIALASQKIQGKATGNKRPKQLPNTSTGNNDYTLLAKLVEQQQQQIEILTQMAISNQAIVEKEWSIDKKTFRDEVTDVQKYNNRLGTRKGAFSF